MKAQDYPIAHFEFMSSLVESLEGLPAQLLKHEYSTESFGSWMLLVRYKGNVACVCYDGKDRYLSVCYSSDKNPPYGFSRAEEIRLDESDSVDSPATVHRMLERIISSAEPNR